MRPASPPRTLSKINPATNPTPMASASCSRWASPTANTTAASMAAAARTSLIHPVVGLVRSVVNTCVTTDSSPPPVTLSRSSDGPKDANRRLSGGLAYPSAGW